MRSFHLLSFVRSLAAVFSLSLATMPVAHGEACDSQTNQLSPGTVNVRIDNDMFGGLGQDQGYSNGFLVSWVSPNMVDYRDDPCLPMPIRGLNSFLTWLQPEGFQEQNMTAGIGQVIYTPSDNEPTELIREDRPYAGALLLSIGYSARRNSWLRTTQIRFGMVGPSAQAGEVQNGWHDIIGIDQFNGWDNQLRDEPVFQVQHERRKRLARTDSESDWGWDLTGHWGGSLGNFATYANTGWEWRAGYKLPDDFGTAPLRPAGENTSPVHSLPARSWSWHAFVAADIRGVLYDITLDGNTLQSSHSVEKRPIVADLGYGIAIYRGPWRVALASYLRSREFSGQEEDPRYGTITIGRRF